MSSDKSLDQIAKHTAELFGAEVYPTYFAGGHKWSDGTIYNVNYLQGELLLKLIPDPKDESRAAILERLSFFDWLCEHGIRVAKPLRSVNNEILERIVLDGTACLARAWMKIPGEHIGDRHPAELADFYEAWGAMLGKMHGLSSHYCQWGHSSCSDAAGLPLISWQREWELFYGWLPEEEVKNAWLEVRTELECLPIRRDNFGFIHNDAHPGNILITDQGLALLDPEVANYHWFMTDLGICLNSEYSRIGHHSIHKSAMSELPELFLVPFLKGYLSQHRLAKEDIHQIRLFLHYRRFLMYAVFYEQIREHDPEYLQAFRRELCDRKIPAADLMEALFIQLCL